MKIVVIFDKKGNVPCFATISPSIEIVKRDLIIACKNDSNLVYGLYPDDYALISLCIGDTVDSLKVDEHINFSDFIIVGDDNG